MAVANRKLIAALRTTAARLERGARYSWAHMGSCNCGHLVQTVTRLSRDEIHRMAVASPGDWGEQAVEYCPSSGYPMEYLLDALFELGLDRRDVVQLERLSDPEILATLPAGQRSLDYRCRTDVVTYLRAWAHCLEAQASLDPAAPGSYPSRSGAVAGDAHECAVPSPSPPGVPGHALEDASRDPVAREPDGQKAVDRHRPLRRRAA